MTETEQDKSIEQYPIRGKNYSILFMVGEVLEVTSTNTTHVTGSGGSGKVRTNFWGEVKGDIQGINISSHTTTTTKVWLRHDNGEEFELKIPGELPLRQGHKTCFVAVSNEGGQWKAVSCVNYTTRTNTPIYNGYATARSFGALHNTWDSALGCMFPIAGLVLGAYYFWWKGILWGPVAMFGIGFILGKVIERKNGQIAREFRDLANMGVEHAFSYV